VSVASARVRVAAHAPLLRAHGVELEYRPTLDEDEYVTVHTAPPARRARVLTRSALRLRGRTTDADLLLVHRLRLLMPAPGLDPPRRIDVYDFDDALYLDSPEIAGWARRMVKRESQRCRAYLRAARLVIAGNAVLADRARTHARRVEIVPSCVDPAAQPVRDHRARETFTVGWIGSRTTSVYLEPVLPLIAEAHERHPDLRLVLVGAESSISAPWIEHRPWALETQAQDLASFDVGLMPLPDTEWARGKSGYKALQYFAAGVPAIVSPVGIARQFASEGPALGATSAREWRAALEQLRDDPVERAQRGTAARSFAERDYSYTRWVPELASLLASV
jgi:glycosyltransferase involved in cell wall biosynthesis